MGVPNMHLFDAIISNTIKGFHDVTSYQANFQSHHTWNHHIGFFLYSLILENIAFYIVQTIKSKLQLRNTNLCTHIRLKFQILLWSKSKILSITTFCCFFLSLYKKVTKACGKILCILGVPHNTCHVMYYSQIDCLHRSLEGGMVFYILNPLLMVICKTPCSMIHSPWIHQIFPKR